MRFRTLIYTILISSTFFVNCKHRSIVLTNDVYLSDFPNLGKRLAWRLKGKSTFIMAKELSISKDFTFKYTTCGCNTEGNYFVSSDTLFLIHHEVNKTTDTIGCDQPLYYIISKNKQLIRYWEREKIEILRSR